MALDTVYSAFCILALTLVVSIFCCHDREIHDVREKNTIDRSCGILSVEFVGKVLDGISASLILASKRS